MNVVISGANRGIGLELCKAYLNRGHHVIGLCRKASPELLGSGAQVLEGTDVTVPDSLLSLSDRIELEQIDILINNAGLLRSQPWDGLEFQPILDQFQVNSVGPLLLSKALERKLVQGSKLVMITSRMGSIADNSSGGSFGYRMSKAALNAATKSLAIDLKPRGIIVALLHPGLVKTDMTGKTGHLTPLESAELLLKRIDEYQLGNSGRFLHANGESLPW
ncbi:MAG: SDR family oxidoreductase [Pseudobacteriovorax sp.]|nr:SDR family oxidoreductase [Pseudobacteriovorax sp.]